MSAGDDDGLTTNTERQRPDRRRRRPSSFDKNAPLKQGVPAIGMARRLGYFQAPAAANGGRGGEKGRTSVRYDGHNDAAPAAEAVRVPVVMYSVVSEDDGDEDGDDDGLPFVLPGVFPSAVTFKLVIDAPGQSPEKAEELIGLMEDCRAKYLRHRRNDEDNDVDTEDGHEIATRPEKRGNDFALDAAAYNSVLRAWGPRTAAAVVNDDGDKTFGAVDAFEGAVRADAFLRRMVERSASTHDDDDINLGIGGEDEEERLCPTPNGRSFSIVLNAWKNAASAAVSEGDASNGRRAAERAEEVLDLLLTTHRLPQGTATARKEQHGHSHATRMVCLGSVVEAWACLSGAEGSRGDEAERAQNVLDTTLDMDSRSQSEAAAAMDLIPFNAVLDAWVRNIGAGGRGDSLSDNDVIDKIARVQDMLHRMDGGRDGGGGASDDYEPYFVDADASSFNHAIRASYAPWTLGRVRLYNNADAERRVRGEALEMALDAYHRLSRGRERSDDDGYVNHQHRRPDAHTYAHMFKAIACLLPPEGEADASQKETRVRLCKDIFQSCCQDGQLTRTLLFVLRRVLRNDEDDLREMLQLAPRRREGSGTEDDGNVNATKLREGDMPQDLRDLPQEWSQQGRRVRALNGGYS